MNKTIKKIIPYILILIIFVGFFGLTTNVTNAELDDFEYDNAEPDDFEYDNAEPNDFEEEPTSPADPTNPTNPKPAPSDGSSPFQQALNEHCTTIASGSVSGCLAQLFYLLFYTIPSFLLTLAGKLFNIAIVISLDSASYKTGFIDQAWVVIRDLSNIFFIFILLYISIQTILGIGGHEGPKKMVAQVIIMALLINFSMFFTRVVIDSSNILALIFYNKLTVVSNGNNLANIETLKNKGVAEKTVSEALTSGFDITRLMGPEFFKAAKNRSGFAVVSAGTAASAAGGAVVGGAFTAWLGPGAVIGAVAGAGIGTFLSWLNSDKVPPSLLISILIPGGLIMYYAIYAFFTAGIAFLSRIIELWIILIFSPFAFMSSALPFLKKVPGYGWDEWLKKLLEISFIAPIFMFFLYLIFKIIEADITKDLLSPVRPHGDQWLLETIALVLIAGFIVLALLMKATKYAKKASGELGEVITSAIKVAGGLALGGGALLGAAALRGTVGSFMKGASTGDTAANRMAGGAARIAAHQATIANPNSNIVQRMQARKEIWRERKDQIKGNLQNLGGARSYASAQRWTGERLNTDQHNVRHAAHARHELDSLANTTTHGAKKTWEELGGDERYSARRQMARDWVIRNNAGNAAANAGQDGYIAALGGVGLGTRKWEQLQQHERDAIDGSQWVGDDGHGGVIAHSRLADRETPADAFINDAQVKQGVISNVVQSTVGGSYDVRNLAKIVMKEQSTGFAKIAMAMTGAMALGMRGGFKKMDVHYGEAQGNFFKDLGNTISESLKAAKINVDLSHVGEEKKEGKGGGEHH